jgi:putative ABC transport system substrate-binding protein
MMCGYGPGFLARGSSMQFGQLTRRECVTLIGGAAAGWPLLARAQQPKLPIIGLMSSGTASSNEQHLTTFREALKGASFVEHRNVIIEYRWAAGNYDRLPAFAKEFVLMPADLIVAFDNTATARAAKAATSIIPIVFSIGTDPVKFGLVQSLNRPGGNVTGVVSLTVGLGAKRLQVFREMLPNSAKIAMLVNPKNPAAETETNEILAAGGAGGLEVITFPASSVPEIDCALVSAAESRVSGVLIQSEPFLTSRRSQIAGLALRYALPAIDAYRDFALAGGLMSYGASLDEAARQLGVYAGRILKGERPVDLPVHQSVKIELVINLNTARALRLAVPPTLLAIADEVIE